MLYRALGWLLLGSFCGCSFFLPSRKALRECRFSVESVAFRGLTDSGSQWLLQIKAINPNADKAHLTRLELAFRHDLDTLMRARSESAINLKGNDSATFPIEATLPYSALPQLLVALQGKAKSEMEVVGDAFIETPLGEWRIKQAVKQHLDVDWNQVSQALEKKMGLPGLRDWIGL